MMGRVEVNYNSQGWGTVCDDLWSIKDGDVVCKMLGFKSAHNVSGLASFGEGQGLIWLDDVFCEGTESSLLDCSHSSLRVHNCRHSEDAGVVCSNNAICPSFDPANGFFTIFGSNTWNTEGRWLEGVTVTATCNQGYAPVEGQPVSTCGSDGSWTPNVPKCLTKCSVLSTINNGRMSSSETTAGTVVFFTCDAGYHLSGSLSLSCLDNGQWSGSVPTCTPTTNLEVRLAGANSNMMGRVEVNYNSQGWGTVCDDLWSIKDGDVVCKMLGFKSAHNVSGLASFGEGQGLIWLDDVFCEGTESSLLDCSHSSLRVHNCRHSEDAGVVCSNNAICPNFEQSPNGQYTISGSNTNTEGRWLEGVTVTVTCNHGYTSVEGQPVSTCGSDGSWTPSISKCLRTCPVLPTITNGNMSSSETTAGTVVFFTCDAGYHLSGSLSLSCLDNGQWSGSVPTCTPRAPSANVGGIAGGIVVGILLVIAIIATVILFWKLSLYCASKKNFYGRVSIKMDDDTPQVNLFSEDYDPLLSSDKESEDVGPLDIRTHT